MAPHKSGAVDQFKTDQVLSNIKPGLIFTGTGQAFQGRVTVRKIEGNDLHVTCQQDKGTPWTETWNLEHTIAGFKSGEYKVVTPAPLPEPPPFKLILREQTPRVLGKVDPIKDKELIATFAIFTKQQHDCVGMSANQLAYKGKRIKKRFFLMYRGEQWYAILNPKMIKKHGQPVQRIEGCKTWPDKAITAQRHLKVTISFQDQDGAHYERIFAGLDAQIVQHEMDHLNGVEEVFTLKMISDKHRRNDPCPCGSGKKYKKCCINLKRS